MKHAKPQYLLRLDISFKTNSDTNTAIQTSQTVTADAPAS